MATLNNQRVIFRCKSGYQEISPPNLINQGNAVGEFRTLLHQEETEVVLPLSQE